MRENARNVHDADERAKAAPGCPFTTSADTVELVVNDLVRALWRQLVHPGWVDRPADVAVIVLGTARGQGSEGALQAVLDKRDGRCVKRVLTG